jgi:hypothetical protein
MLKSFFCLLMACCMAWTTLPVLAGDSSLAIAATTAPGQDLTIKGKIKLINVEGGCYQLLTTDNTRYELQGEFPKQDGLIVKVRGTIDPDQVTTCQVGRPFQVKSIQIIRNH